MKFEVVAALSLLGVVKSDDNVRGGPSSYSYSMPFSYSYSMSSRSTLCPNIQDPELPSYFDLEQWEGFMYELQYFDEYQVDVCGQSITHQLEP